MNALLFPTRRVPATDALLTRSYRPGDETRLVRLWNDSYAHYAGIATRTVEYWRWSILARPGMSQQDILLIEAHDHLLGYAVLWTEGKVLEMAVDPALAAASRSSVALRLLRAIEERARTRDCDSIELLLPACDRIVDRTLRAAGYAVEDGPALIVRVLNPLGLLRALTAGRAARLRRLRGWQLLIRLNAGDDPFLLQHRLRVRFGESIDIDDISGRAATAADAELQLSLAALAELLFCGSSPRRLLEAADLRVEPHAATSRALEFLGALAVEAHWYTPLADSF